MRVILSSAVIAFVLALSWCTPSIAMLVSSIEAQSHDLIYVSETDSPIYSVRADGSLVPPLTKQAFLVSIGKPEDTEVEERHLDQFFTAARMQDIRWKRLKHYLEDHLDDIHVFTIGDIQLDIYVVGIYHGALVGIRVFAVET